MGSSRERTGSSGGRVHGIPSGECSQRRPDLGSGTLPHPGTSLRYVERERSAPLRGREGEGVGSERRMMGIRALFVGRRVQQVAHGPAHRPQVLKEACG